MILPLRMPSTIVTAALLPKVLAAMVIASVSLVAPAMAVMACVMPSRTLNPSLANPAALLVIAAIALSPSRPAAPRLPKSEALSSSPSPIWRSVGPNLSRLPRSSLP